VGGVFGGGEKKKPRTHHTPWKFQKFFVYPTLKKGQPAFRVNNILDRPIHPMFIKGFWETRNDKPCMVVYRNELLHENDRHFETIIPVVWEDAPTPDGQFYELEAEVRDGGFFVVTAQGPFDPPPKATEFTPPPAPAKPELATAPSVPPALLLTVKEIRAMATPAKIQLTCKLNEVPKHRELADKRIEFFLKDGDSDRIFTVRMKPKIFKKLTEYGFADWVAAIAGKIGTETETGFELKKAREGEAKEKSAAIVQPKTSDSGALAKGKAEVEPKSAVA
jgi:hypothetical protein